jgi:mannose-6-phosphate isomerase
MTLLQLLPQYHARVWGGQRLKAAEPPIGEAWIVYEHNHIAAGPLAGRTLAEVAEAQGAALLGPSVVAHTGRRFPLLIKLLDCADWLSIQVHPNDEQAVQLEGPGHFGKTEAWHILEAEAGAQLIAGVRPGVSAEVLAQAIRGGALPDLVDYHPVRAGDTVFMPAGTLHALGPGLLLYEVQQSSDITYRVYDWGRPASAGRALHLEQSVTVTSANGQGQHTSLPPLAAQDVQTLVHCPYFHLEVLTTESQPMALDTAGQSFHTLTVVQGTAEVIADEARVVLGRFESVTVPALAGAYRVEPRGALRLLRASVSHPT